MKKFRDLLIAGIDEDIQGTTIERLVMVKTIFEDEMVLPNNNMRRKPIVDLLQDWLQGLCSTVSIPFMNHEIITWYEEQLGRKAKNDNECYNWLEKYWPQCARTLFEMLYK